jgi:hypothetical protein
MKSSFRNRLQDRYQIKGDDTEQAQQPKQSADKPGEEDTQTGSSHPENWQTTVQSGKTPEEIRQDAIALAGILQSWQSQVLQAQDYYKELTANTDKYLHLYNPILIKGLSREKLETIALICQKFAKLATIV